MSCHCHHKEDEEDLTLPEVNAFDEPIRDIFSAQDGETKTSEATLTKEATQNLLREFEHIMTQRAETYVAFAKVLDTFRESEDAIGYQQRCGEITERFKELSAAVIALETALKEGNRNEWAGRLREVQELERRKLHATVHTQMLHVRYTLLAKNEWDSVYIDTVRQLRKEMGECDAEIVELMEEVRYFVHEDEYDAE